MDALQTKDCEQTCPLAARSQERLNAAFARIDEMRQEAQETAKETNQKFEKQYGYIQERVRMQLFIWIIGATIAIGGGLMGIMWSHFGRAGDLAGAAIDRMDAAAKDNAKDIQVAITRIDEYIRSHSEAQRRAEGDQNRVLEKLDEIERSVKELQIGFGAMQSRELPN